MNTTARAQVLADYRQLRRTGIAPAHVMEAVRNDRANMVAMFVAHGRKPPPALVDEWQEATDYLNSMTTRTTWWWQATTPGQLAKRRKARRRRTLFPRKTGSTIPT